MMDYASHLESIQSYSHFLAVKPEPFKENKVVRQAQQVKYAERN
jgi:hypothetical protein